MLYVDRMSAAHAIGGAGLALAILLWGLHWARALRDPGPPPLNADRGEFDRPRDEGDLL
jgi:hypothetical protein